MKLSKRSIYNIISFILILLGLLALLYIIYYFQTHSSEFVTHTQLYQTIGGVAFGIISILLGMWIQISNKLTEFAQQLGEFKGTLRFIERNVKVKRKAKG